MDSFKQDDDETPVLFRAERSGDYKGSVTAVFPTIAADYQSAQMTCFAHVGQHSGCTMGWYRLTRPATEAEYADLKRELESAPYGYRLKVYKRILPSFREARRAG